MSTGRLESIFIYPEKGADPQELKEVGVTREDGVHGDHVRSENRRVTFLSLDQWRHVQKELDEGLPPQTRRSNLIVSGIDLPAMIGKRLKIGGAEFEMTVEIAPCGRMDLAFQGLRAALVPEMRGGVGARVLESGTVRVGDEIMEVAVESEASS
jgi:MOSC domain-containing protein YiiM